MKSAVYLRNHFFLWFEALCDSVLVIIKLQLQAKEESLPAGFVSYVDYDLVVMTTYHRPHRLLLGTQPDSPPSNESRTHNGYTSETKFDTNMVIILAALLCALICALGLNSIVRCALRCSRRFAFESPDETAARLAATGLKKSMLRRIPVAEYGTGVVLPATDCPICLGEFEDGEKVRVLPRCHHGFHVRCIDIWLAAHSSCPTCRQSLLEQQPSCPDDTTDTEALRLPANGSGGHADVSVSAEEVG